MTGSVTVPLMCCNHSLNLSDSQMPLHVFIVKMRNWALGDHCTPVHDVKAVTHVEAEIEILFDEQDPNSTFGTKRLDGIGGFPEIIALVGFQAFAAEFFNRLANVINDVGLNAFSGFVQQ